MVREKETMLRGLLFNEKEIAIVGRERRERSIRVAPLQSIAHTSSYHKTCKEALNLK